MKLREHIAGMACALPEAEPGRCVHECVEVASCQRCVKACPRDAWKLDDEELAIDAALCDGCGICVAHCPESALSLPGTSLAAFAARPELILGCERAKGEERSDCPLPCVNALGTEQVAFLYRAGLRQVVLNIGDCANCTRDDDNGLVPRLVLFNRVLAQRGLVQINVQMDSGMTDAVDGRGARPDVTGAQLSRRGFLRHLVGVVTEQQEYNKDSGWHAPGEYLPVARQGDLALNVPRIDASRCNGCDACIRVCPHRALSLSDRDDAYVVSADRCTGCRLCLDVCDQCAVNVEPVAAVEQFEVALQRRRCPVCGAPFRRPVLAERDTVLCHVCARVNHHHKLFQVF